MSVTLSPQSARFWAEYERVAGPGASARLYEAFHFGDGEALADELAALVLAGTKRATAALQWAFEAERKVPPKPGDLSIVERWSGEPVCIIETVAVETVPFDAVDADFAATEGEGDGSLAYWRRAHDAFFGRECIRLGREPNARMPVVCERFRVVYPVPPAR